jgi:hypothetical protein
MIRHQPFSPWLLGAGAVGFAAFALFYRSANPRADVPLRVTRAAAVDTARAFLAARGAPIADLKQAVQFSGNTVGLVFLQRTIGLTEASRWARDRVPIWSWQMRWFKPLQKEEWQVRIGVAGAVEGFAHLIEESTPGANLTQDSALVLAEQFLRARGFNLAQFDRVEASTEKRDKRTDHHFTWEKHGTSIPWQAGSTTAGTGAVRIDVDVQGDAIGRFRRYLKVPEAFGRQLTQTLSFGQVLALASLGLTFVMFLIALGISIARHRRDDVRWRPAFGIAGVIALLVVAQGIAMFPRAKFTYSTDFPWGVYVGILAIALLFVSLAYGCWVLFTLAAGESLGRETFAESVAGLTDVGTGKLRTPAVARASLNGYALGFVFLGYLAVFYVVAQRWFGAWLPAEGPYSDIFNTTAPFLAPLTLALVAAVTEEGAFRLFGISLVRRYFKSTTLALVLPAVVWAFAHSNYAVFPVYVRGIELTIGGIVFGLAFLRFGLLTCIVAHYVVDAVLIGLPLLSAGTAGYTTSGLVVMGLALLPALLGLLARRSPVPAPPA